jgi:putative ABC transport system permease protein
VFLQDLRYAVRTLRLNAGFTAVAVTCLTLAIGVNTMVFSMVNGVLLEPLPFADPDRLMILSESSPPLGVRRSGVSYANLRDWRERSRSFSAMAGVQTRSFTIADRSEPERYSGAAISWELFSTLGVRPARGRDFVAADDRPGAEPVVLLSDEIWRVRYSSDPGIVGRPLLIDGRPHTIVGILPPDFEFPVAQKLWVPLAPQVTDEPRTRRGLMTVARLAPGVAMEVAQEELRAVAAGLAREFPENDRWTALVRPIKADFIPDEVNLILLTMMGAVTLVLIVACANVANLMLARAAARRREISIRAAIGAGRFRIARQLLTEAILLALLAVPPGIALAYAGNELVRRAMPPDNVPYTVQWEISWVVVLYSVALALGTGILFGLAPALQTANLNLQSALKEGGRGTGGVGPRTRLRSALVVCEVGLSLVLLVGASLFVRSFLNLRDFDVGFDTAPLMTLRLFMTGDAYATEEARLRRVEDIVRGIETVPGVAASFASNWVPLSGGGGGGRILIEGRTWPAGEEPFFGFTAVTPHFLQTLNVPLTRGRDFTDAEGQSRSAVALISEGMAERFWPDEDPVGRQFRLTDPQIPDSFTIIGVVRNIRHFQVDPVERETAHAYVPYPYAPTPNTGVHHSRRVGRACGHHAGRAIGDPAARCRPPAVRGPVHARGQAPRLVAVRHLRLDVLRVRRGGAAPGRDRRVRAARVFGVATHAGDRRPRGAWRVPPRRHRPHRRAGTATRRRGILLGLVGAFGVTHLVASFLYNITPTDPLTFASASLFLIAVALFASYVPTRRATAVDPLIALRSE